MYRLMHTGVKLFAIPAFLVILLEVKYIFKGTLTEFEANVGFICEIAAIAIFVVFVVWDIIEMRRFNRKRKEQN